MKNNCKNLFFLSCITYSWASCSSQFYHSGNDENNIYCEILPIIISNEDLVGLHTPPIPPPENKVSMDSISIRDKSHIEALNLKINAFIIDEYLLGSNRIHSFVEVGNDFFLNDDCRNSYNRLFKGEMPSKKLSLKDFYENNILFIPANEANQIDTAHINLIGAITLSRIGFNKNGTMGCFYLKFKSIDDTYGFEMFAFIERKFSNWEIIKTTRYW